MGIKLKCMCCGRTDVFGDIHAAQIAKWRYTDAEISGKYTPITLCPECNSNSMYEHIIREKIRGVTTNG